MFENVCRGEPCVRPRTNIDGKPMSDREHNKGKQYNVEKMSIKAFAKQTGITENHIKDLISGRCSISKATAKNACAPEISM